MTFNGIAQSAPPNPVHTGLDSLDAKPAHLPPTPSFTGCHTAKGQNLLEFRVNSTIPPPLLHSVSFVAMLKRQSGTLEPEEL